jgi:hypothetical protein
MDRSVRKRTVIRAQGSVRWRPDMVGHAAYTSAGNALSLISEQTSLNIRYCLER